MRWGIVGLKGCLQRIMAAGKAIMNLMDGQSVPTCVPAFLKVDWSNSVYLVSPLHLSWWWWPDRPTRPPWDETAAAYFLPPFALLPKDNRKEMKERGCFLFSCIFYTIYFGCLPIFLSLFPPTYVYKHTL